MCMVSAKEGIEQIPARGSFNLVRVEQLVSLLGPDTIKPVALPLCSPKLNDASYRDTYECSRSMTLAIFVTHALT